MFRFFLSGHVGRLAATTRTCSWPSPFSHDHPHFSLEKVSYVLPAYVLECAVKKNGFEVHRGWQRLPGAGEHRRGGAIALWCFDYSRRKPDDPDADSNSVRDYEEKAFDGERYDEHQRPNHARESAREDCERSGAASIAGFASSDVGACRTRCQATPSQAGLDAEFDTESCWRKPQCARGHDWGRGKHEQQVGNT